MIGAVLNFLKPPGMTSHDAVSFVRRIYQKKRVGHSGTLDPAAAGVLPIYLGNATRLVEYADSFDKTYRAEVLLGIKTDTGDDTGRVLQRKTVELPAEQQIDEIVRSFQGGYEQIPPMYSAIKIDGRKLYELARAGQEVERQPRRIEIPLIKLMAVHDCRLTIEVTCSKGTYIRTLCEDIGDRLDIPATMSLLLRTRVGPFAVNQASTIEEITADPAKALLPADFAVSELPACILNETETGHLKQGRAILKSASGLPGGQATIVRLYDFGQNFFGIGRLDAITGLLKPVKIFSGGMGAQC
jgi:tRNA pseudouridine55 synthase